MGWDGTFHAFGFLDMLFEKKGWLLKKKKDSMDSNAKVRTTVMPWPCEPYPTDRPETMPKAQSINPHRPASVIVATD